jgi:thiamine-phosphate pyrophosphorylase
MCHFVVEKYHFIKSFDSNLLDKIDKKTGIIYRNYQSKNSILEIIKIKKYLNNKKKFYLSNNIKLALKLNLDGAYIPSFNKDFSHLSYSYKRKFKIIGSAHNVKEIKIKEMQKVDQIFISSLFKKNKNFLGINKFKLLSKQTKKKVVALGGIKKKNLKKLRLTCCKRFSGISFFR